MSGKAYSIREMKIIVDYLTEHKAYGDVKGRKMWMEFAGSQLTNRTWQSLKETFLKRILPDIHNPYYKLTIEQINSFRQGYDVAERNKNKLEIQTVSEDSTSSCNAENQKQPDTDNAKEEGNTPGEGIKCSKIPSRTRSSAETVILDNCYETTEDIQRDLESPVQEMKKEQISVAARSLRDCITYSEPLTPMIQEVLEDFASEPEDEPQMVIVESTIPDTENLEKPNQESITEIETSKPENVVITDVAKNAKGLSSDVVEEVLLSEIKEFGNQTRNNQVKNPDKPVTSNNQPETSDNNVSKDNIGATEENTEAESSKVTDIPTVDEIINLITDDSNTKEMTEIIPSIDNTNKVTPEKGTQGCSNSTTDTLLPNNPEGLHKRTSNETENQNKDDGSIIELSEDVTKTATRKRTASHDTAKSNDSKKKKVVENKTTAVEKVKTNGSVGDTEIDKDIANDLEKVKDCDKPQAKTKFNDTETPSTSKDVKNIQAASNINKPTAEIENPCLKNVSLFDEQYNNIKYDTSDTSEVEELTPNNVPTIQKPKHDKELSDVVMLKSHSDSNSNEKPVKEMSKDRGVSKKQREKALANVFGFSSGPVSSHRKRRLSRHKKSTSRNNSHNPQHSSPSEWTSETNSELYVSPPRARKNRPSKKYLKPESARILSLEEEGGLFVMYGKKIYPLVKDGRIIKNYLTYLPESDSEEDESYWKLKYVEEKKKSDELKKLLQEAKEPRVRKSNSPILQPKSTGNPKTSHNTNQQNSDNSKELCIPGQGQKQEEENVPHEKIKIKFTKNNEEVHLEGHWPQIHPVLAEVVQIFHKESNQTVKNKSKMLVEAPQSKASSSRSSTPAIMTAVDPEVHERVNEIEKEIFKEIEARDKEEQSKQDGVETNVTKRKAGRPRKSSSSTTQTPTKKPKRSASKTTVEATKPVAEAENKSASVATSNRVSTRRNNIVSPRMVLNESINTNKAKVIQTRGSKTKLENSVDDDDDVRYMLPPNNKRQARSTSNTRTKEQKPQKSTENVDKIVSPPSNFSLNSLDSTQGYQDSDMSPPKTDIRKKKLINRSTYALRSRNEYNRNVRRRSHPYLNCGTPNDYSNASARANLKMTAQNSSLNTEAYRSESYQLLMPQVIRSFTSLERIDEAPPISDMNSARDIETSKNPAVGLNSDVASSSNVSLPLSPELSVVENISVSKDILNCVNYPTLNETQCNEINDIQFCNKYIISGVDVTMPLMQQDCDIENCNTNTVVYSPTADDPVNPVTESLLNKICTFNLRDQSPMTETLNQKLRNLLLESAKKVGTGNVQGKENMMEVDDTNTEVRTKAGNKKRCSTPRKRKGIKKSAAPNIARLVEEEHVESCSFGGRRSCPPVVQDYPFEDNALDLQIANLTVTDEAKGKRKGRKVKDIIKVKIVRPKSKTAKEKSTSSDASKLSVYTDSGINDSGSGVFLPISDSVDLIHNHSETCLLARECCGDSVEFIENPKSVISIDSNSMQSNEWQSQLEYTDLENMMHECFSSNAQDVNSFYNEAENIEDTTDTVYHSPAGTEISHNSLITEDLSDEIQPPDRPSKWYLLSEEETLNSNLANSPTATNVASVGANLKQIFPITYAVPNLSTITEISKDTDDSRKPTLETEGDAFCVGSVFDSIF